LTSIAVEERIRMPARHLTEEPLLPELEAIAAAAADELRVLMDESREGEQAPRTAAVKPRPRASGRPRKANALVPTSPSTI
jgi:hypothetical protein